jgi:bacillithiol system protein YtxJ
MTMTHLESQADLSAAIAESADHPVFLFKHSTRCPVSFAAEAAYLKFINDLPADADVACTHLDLIRYREVSNAIADTLDVHHQSPQAILLVDGRAVWHASHYDITSTALTAALAATS